MLHALINGNKELAKALALDIAIAAIYSSSSKLLGMFSSSKLYARLFLEAYKECKERCDLKNESFRLALARLFFYHV
jgi:hypothetical protein